MFRFVKPTLWRAWRPTWMVEYNGKIVGSVSEIHPGQWFSGFKIGDNNPEHLPGVRKSRVEAAKRLVNGDIEKFKNTAEVKPGRSYINWNKK